MELKKEMLYKTIRRIISEEIDGGNSCFAIYPYGEVGMLAENILRKNFNIEPVYIIDNTICKYNKDVISVSELREEYDKKTKVLIATDNSVLAKELERTLHSFIGVDNIIVVPEKIMEYQNESCSKSRKGLRIHEIISKIQYNKTLRKVVFLDVQYSFFNVITPLLEEFIADNKYDVRVVAIDKKVKDYCDVMQYACELTEHYNIALEKPDIVVTYNLWGGTGLTQNVRENAKIVVGVAHILILYGNIFAHWNTSIKKGLNYYKPDYLFVDSYIYHELDAAGLCENRIVEMGNPKFDGIYNGIKEDHFRGYLKKLKGKKNIAFILSHGVVCHFDIYIQSILSYFGMHKEMGLIIRLHPSFVNERFSDKIWCHEELEVLKDYCIQSDNIVWDMAPTYIEALSCADGILTEPNCGVNMSALPTLKPIADLYREDEKIYNNQKLLNNMYSIHNEEELYSFFYLIQMGTDPMRKQREDMAKEYIMNFDGKNSLRIKEFIENRLKEMV